MLLLTVAKTETVLMRSYLIQPTWHFRMDMTSEVPCLYSHTKTAGHCVSKRASGGSLFRDFFVFFDSVSLDFLALWPRLSSSVLGGVTPGEEMKQQHARGRGFMSEPASLWSFMCVWCPTVAGRGTRRGGAHPWSRRGDGARARKGTGRKRRRRSTHLWSACLPPGGTLEKSRKRNSEAKTNIGAAVIQPSFKTTCRNVFSPGTAAPPSAGGSPTSADPDRWEDHREASDVHSSAGSQCVK